MEAVNQDWEHAVFQDCASHPAAFELGRVADFYGSLAGHDIEHADADQAYLQAEFNSTQCWAE